MAATSWGAVPSRERLRGAPSMRAASGRRGPAQHSADIGRTSIRVSTAMNGGAAARREVVGRRSGASCTIVSARMVNQSNAG